MIEIDEHFNKIMEYESRLASLAVTEAIAKYLNENVEEKNQRKKELYELKREIASADINSYYKDSFLKTIDNYFGLLEPEKQNRENDLLNILFPAGLGFILGILAKNYFDKAIDYTANRFEQGIMKGIRKELMKNE